MEQPKKTRFSFEVTTAAVFTLVLLSNFIVIQHAKGYFSYYGIRLSEVDFVPQMYDYVRITVPALIATATVMLGVYGILWVNDRFTEELSDRLLAGRLGEAVFTFAKKRQRLLEIVEIILNILLKLISIGLLVYVAWTMGTTVAPKLGSKSAEMTYKYSSVSNRGESLQDVIIYRGGGRIILKTYNTKSSKFEDGYRVLTDSSYTTRTFHR